MAVKSKKASTNSKSKKPKEAKPVQQWIPNTEPETIPEVEQAVLAFEDAKEEHKEASKEIKARTLMLMDKIRAHALDKYQAASGKIYSINHKAGILSKKKKKAKHPVTGEVG